MKKGSFVIRSIWVINLVFTFAVLVSWIVYFLPIGAVSSLSLFNLITPVLLLAHLFFCLFWAAKKRKRAVLSLSCLVLSYLVFGSVYQFGRPKTTHDGNTFTVMTYNVRQLNKNEELDIPNVDTLVYNFILEQRPDIICMQESFYTMKHKSPLDDVYPHRYVDFIYGEHDGKVINSIYSKFPILEGENIEFEKSFNGAFSAKVLIAQDTVQLYNVHLQSFSVIPDMDYFTHEDSGRMLKRIRVGLKKQEQQVEQINKHMEGNPHPKVLVGDFNNTQFSKVYRVLKGNFQDSFQEVGSGFGKTFQLFGIPMRIDYIFADERMEIISHANFDIELSDHYPVMTTLRLKPEE